jgi:hypothetical protein
LASLALASSGCLAKSKDGSGSTCAADTYEANDTQETARELAELQDDPNSEQKPLSLSITSDADDDWFRVHVKDTGAGGDPTITAFVSSASFEITSWFVCDGARSQDSQCQYGSEGVTKIENAAGCEGKEYEPATDSLGSTVLDTGRGATTTTDCKGTSDDNGVLYIRVRRRSLATACSYELSVKVE